MDGNGSLFATLNGNHREILHKMSVELPKKHGTLLHTSPTHSLDRVALPYTANWQSNSQVSVAACNRKGAWQDLSLQTFEGVCRPLKACCKVVSRWCPDARCRDRPWRTVSAAFRASPSREASQLRDQGLPPRAPGPCCARTGARRRRHRAFQLSRPKPLQP